MKKLFKILTNKVLLTIIFFILQVSLFVFILLTLTSISIYIYLGFIVLSIIVTIYIISKNQNPNYKLAWVVPILIFPLFGGFMYLFFGRQKLKRKQLKKLRNLNSRTSEILQMTAETVGDKNIVDATSSKIAGYIRNADNYPVYSNTEVTYYETGEKFFEAFKLELKKAEKFIFMEYFIIERGKMWNEILEILVEKAELGVDVRVIYDDVGCLFTLPHNYCKTLKKLGIKANIFNPLRPSFNVRMNNRTHRKITVIDGNVGFTGGLNLADEYINEVNRFGYWKDTAIKLEGVAVWSFTIMFLRFWGLYDKENIKFKDFAPTKMIKSDHNGYVQPLSDTPSDEIQLIENSFIQMFSNANEYIYINTPYLILDDEILSSLCLAAKSGIDVKITMPHVPDKKMVFMMSRSFYPQLLKSGVKIYEYLPGFVHAKSVITDNHTAYIGTCNMDYRSFYLHFECGAMLYDVPCIKDMKKDYLDTLNKCLEITYEKATDVTVFTKIARSIMRLIAPML